MIRTATPLQAGMYFHAVADGGTGVDVEHVIIETEAPIDADAFFDAWQATIEQFDILRATVQPVDGTPALVIADQAHVDVVRHDLRGTVDIDDRLHAMQMEDRLRGFDLHQGPLLRFVHCLLPGDRTWTLWSFHHVLLDGRSFPLVLERVLSAYAGSAADQVSATDMHGYAVALVALDHAPALKRWEQKLQSIEGPSSIPSALDEAAMATVEATETRLPVETSTSIRRFADQSGVSVNNIVQAAWALALHHHSQQQTVVFGSTRAGRHVVPNTDDTIGLFILTVPFVVEFDAASTTIDLLGRVRQEQHELRELEAVPLEMIQRASGFGATPVFNSLVMYDEATLDTRMHSRLGDVVEGWRFDYVGQTNYPLTLLAYGEDEILLRLEYATNAHSDRDARNILDRVVNLITAMVVDPLRPAVELPYLTEDDLSRLQSWNDTANDWDQSATLLDLLDAQAAATPDVPAISHRDRQYTYREFHDLVAGLANHLRSRGVGPEVLVGVAAERSIELELAIHAIVTAGGGFVPLDPALPDDRLAFMANDAGVSLVLTQDEIAQRPAFTDVDVLVIDADEPHWPTHHTASVEPRPTARNLAYALFTSGSTGTPKCAANEHRGIVNRIRWMQSAFPLDQTDVVLQKTPYSFDVSVWEHFWPLCFGAQLVIADPGDHQDPRALARAINDAAVTTVHFVPSMLQLFVEEATSATCTTLRRIIASGEALPRQLQDRVFGTIDSELHNLYGPTEAAIDVTWWACDATSPLAQVPIGTAIANTQIHILDGQCNPLPPGVAGELHIGGIQVGRGYVNRDELTVEKFLPDPFGYDEQIYKTGDLARFMSDGNVEYLGRLDHQVKIRGLRIELGEIEAVILDHNPVRETVVVAREDQPGNQQLVAYTVGDALDVPAIKEHCARVLPKWMIPDQWIQLDAFPLNTSGKVDRKQLPAPVFERTSVVAPESASEELVAGLWAEVLEHEGFGRREIFFDIGGSSLALIRLGAMMSDELGREVAVADLLRHTTVEAQAKHLVDGAGGADAAVDRASKRAADQRAARSNRRVVRR